MASAQVCCGLMKMLCLCLREKRSCKSRTQSDIQKKKRNNDNNKNPAMLPNNLIIKKHWSHIFKMKLKS